MNLSIIIPHFNGSGFLEKLLQSIENNKDIQIIVIDDMSELFHLKAIKLLQNKYNFELYQNNRIKSAGTCRNIGLEKAKGEWILFADSDDYFVDRFYEKVRKYFKSKNDVIFFTPTSQYLDTDKIADRHLSFEKKILDYLRDKNKLNELLLRYTYVVPWSRMIKKQFIDNHKINFDEVKVSEDVMFATKVGHFMKRFDVTSDVIYCIIKRPGSFSKKIIKEDVFDMKINIKVLYIKFLNTNISKKELNTVMKPYIYNRAAELLLQSFRSFGVKKFLKVYSLYRQENIKWFRIIYLNPFKIIKYIFAVFYKYLGNKKYNNIR